MAAPKISTFGDGTPYVPANGWAEVLAWLIDFAVFVLSVATGLVVLIVIDQGRPPEQQLTDGVLILAAIALLFLVPLLYGGLWFRGGRALGGVITGTRVVRARDGGRIGARAPWAMVARTILLPLLVAAVVVGGGVGGPGGKPSRTGIDVKRTRRLHEEGYPLTPRDAPQARPS